MKVEVSDAPKSQKLLNIELEHEKLTEQEDIECDSIAKTAKVPGFRQGKTPKDIVKKQYYHKIRTQALEKIVNSAVRDALMSNNISPLAQPDVRNMVFDPDKPITFSEYVDVSPDVKLGNLNAGKFLKYSINVTDEDVEKRLSVLQEEFAEYKDVERAVKKDDETIIDFEGKVDDVPFEGGSAKGQHLIIGSEQFIPGFESGMVGMEKGSARDIPVKFPEEYHEKTLAGKDAIFSVTVHSIKERVLPELNNDFVKKIIPNAESMEQLRTLLKKDMQAEADRELKSELLEKILEELLTLNNFEVPMSIVNEQSEYLLKQTLSRYYQMGVNPELIGLPMDSMRERLVPSAEKLVKKAVLINAVASKENIAVSQQDFEDELKRLAENINYPVEELRKEYAKNKHSETNIREGLLRFKVSDYLAAQNEVEIKEVSWKDYEEIIAAERKASLEKDADEGDVKEDK